VFHNTKLESLASARHSNLLDQFVSYEETGFFWINWDNFYFCHKLHFNPCFYIKNSFKFLNSLFPISFSYPKDKLLRRSEGLVMFELQASAMGMFNPVNSLAVTRNLWLILLSKNWLFFNFSQMCIKWVLKF
jgi:hypothetical protein